MMLYLKGIEIPEHSSGSELHFFSLKQWTTNGKTKESMENEIEKQNEWRVEQWTK